MIGAGGSYREGGVWGFGECKVWFVVGGKVEFKVWRDSWIFFFDYGFFLLGFSVLLLWLYLF